MQAILIILVFLWCIAYSPACAFWEQREYEWKEYMHYRTRKAMNGYWNDLRNGGRSADDKFKKVVDDRKYPDSGAYSREGPVWDLIRKEDYMADTRHFAELNY